MNIYQVETLLQLNVTFYDVSLNLPADPTTVALFIEDPNGVVTEVASNLLVRTGVGTYYSDFLPTMPGKWTYKWQGTGNSVIATSRDTSFFIQGSPLVS
jgi:hypothetical protein